MDRSKQDSECRQRKTAEQVGYGDAEEAVGLNSELYPGDAIPISFAKKMKRIKTPTVLNAFILGISFLFLFVDSSRAEPLPIKVDSEGIERIPDGSYLIPPDEQNGGTETSVQIVDGDACFVSVIGTNDSKPFQIDAFKRDDLEVITVEKGDERRVFVSKAGEPILPRMLTPEQKQELRAIGLTIKIYLDILAKNHAKYRKE